MRDDLRSIVTGLIDNLGDPGSIDLVDQFAYPFPVTMICRLLGVPHEDEPRFHVWADILAASLDPDPDADPAERQRKTHDSRMELGMYLAGLIEERRKQPGDDMLSQLATGHGQDESMSTMELLSTAALLLIAGHETTVNLITNGMLTLLRNPDVLERLRRDPALAAPLVEELLRFEPPVQLLPQRTPLVDIEVRGVTIPKGSSMWLILASGNRDPQRFENPDRFDPDRPDVQHLGLGSGIHSCFGAPWPAWKPSSPSPNWPAASTTPASWRTRPLPPERRPPRPPPPPHRLRRSPRLDPGRAPGAGPFEWRVLSNTSITASHRRSSRRPPRTPTAAPPICRPSTSGRRTDQGAHQGHTSGAARLPPDLG